MGTANWHPKWWTEETHGNAWDRVKDAMKRDWEQTKADFGANAPDLNQDIGDTVKQAAGKQAIPPTNVPNPPDADDRKDARKDAKRVDWRDVEGPMEYGYEARHQYGSKYSQWNDELDRTLRSEWSSSGPTARNWDEVRPYVRRGYEYKRS